MSERLPDIVTGKENVVRYLLENSKFTASTGNIRHQAFLPRPDTLQTSVYRINGCTEPKIWNIGQEYVAGPQRKEVLARVDVVASAIISVGLTINPDTDPHPRHANIEGWPADKSARKLKAQEICRKASLCINPNP